MTFWVLYDIYITCIIHFDFASILFTVLASFFEQDVTVLFAICELHMVIANESK